MGAIRAIRVIGMILSIAVAAASVYAGYTIFHRVNPDPWEKTAAVVVAR